MTPATLWYASKKPVPQRVSASWVLEMEMEMLTTGLLAGAGRRAERRRPNNFSCLSTLRLLRPSLCYNAPQMIGDDKALGRFKKWLRKLGYDSEALAGERQGSVLTREVRQGGVVVAWRRCEFRRCQGKKGQARAAQAVITGARLTSALQAAGARKGAGEAAEVYAGRRALAVHLERGRGPHATRRIHAIGVYLPAGASNAVKEAFVRCLVDFISGLGGSWIMPGDYNLALEEAHRATRRPLSSAEQLLAAAFGGAAAARGAPVAFGCDGHAAPWSHHAANALSHSTVDHILVDRETAARARPHPQRPPSFPNSLDGAYSAWCVSDHLTLVAEVCEGRRAACAHSRRPAASWPS